MKERFINKRYSFVFYFMGIIAFTYVLVFLFNNTKVYAHAIVLSTELYEEVSVEEKEFSDEYRYKKAAFFHGENVGSLYIISDNSQIATSSKNGITAYEVDEDIKLLYHHNTLNNWSVVNSSQKQIGGLEVEKIKEGSIIILKSFDGVNWTSEAQIQNVLDTDNRDLLDMHMISYEDIKKGVYFKIYIVYELEQNEGDMHSFCTEKTTFFLCYKSNPLSVVNIVGRSILNNDEEVNEGFVIEKNGANVSVEVKRDNWIIKNVSDDKNSFYDVGKYTITSKSPTGRVYENRVTVKEGINSISLNRKIYVNPEDDGYTKDLYFGNDFNGNFLTTLFLANDGSSIRKSSTQNRYDIYGISGSDLFLILRINDRDKYLNNGWEVVDDDWGRKEKQTIEGAWTGVISSGAFVVQTSMNGEYWVNADLGRYADGLYTTDYTNIYGDKGDVLAYSFAGEKVLNGVYLRVIYAYKIKQINGDEEKRILEEYSFYICYDSLEAVTFHNLSVEEDYYNITEDEVEIEILKAAETLKNASFTKSGFIIDISGNPTVSYQVFLNGSEIDKKAKYTEKGKYDIKLKSKAGADKTVTIFVDDSDYKSTLRTYFSDTGIISGKRIFDKNEYPIYEGGKNTKLILKEISSNDLPLYGEIVNLDTGKVMKINPDRRKRTFEFVEAGEYIISLNNNITCITDDPSGDNKNITIRFRIIPEGMAPGPVINKQSLSDHMLGHMSSVYPKYYGLSFSSSANGKITLAFKTWQEAFDYASNYEANCVQYDEDKNVYRYTGSFIINRPKEEYNSKWDLTAAINYFAELAIQECYFDMSDKYSYLTLENRIINSYTNIRKLELNTDVVIFAEGNEALLKDIDALPILNDLPYAYLEPGVNGAVNSDKEEFEFEKDENSYDSYAVSIADEKGTKFIADYKRSIEEQLKEHQCVTGKITITERNKYIDSTVYEAVYFANGENTAEIKLSYVIDDNEKETTISQKDAGINIRANIFTITDIIDDLDPYNLVLIKRDDWGNDAIVSYTKDDLHNDVYADDGVYHISVINRIGNKYEFDVTVIPSDYATIMFEGEGTEELKTIVVKKGTTNVVLPEPKRNGYEFLGYRDANDNLYEELIIQNIDNTGTIVLHPLWRQSKCHIIIKDQSDRIISETDSLLIEHFELKAPQAEKGYKFDYWLYDGKKLDSNIVDLSSGGDFEFIAVFTPLDENKCHICIKDNQGNAIYELEAIPDSDIELTIPEADEGYKFDCWIYNGEKLYENKIHLNSAGEYSVVAVFSLLDENSKCCVYLKTQNGDILNILSVEPNSDLELIIPEPEDGYKFDYWMFNGEVLNGNTLHLNMPGDYDVIAVFSKKRNIALIVFVVIVIISIIGVLIFLLRKKMKTTINENDNNT